MSRPGWQSTAVVTYKWARRVVIAVIGGTVVLIGLAMMVLPGPGLVVIPVGLGILGLEFAWARSWLKRVRKHADDIFNDVREGVRDGRLWRRSGGGPRLPPDPPAAD